MPVDAGEDEASKVEDEHVVNLGVRRGVSQGITAGKVRGLTEHDVGVLEWAEVLLVSTVATV